MRYWFCFLMIMLSGSAYALDGFHIQRVAGRELNITFTLPEFMITSSKENPSLSQIRFTDSQYEADHTAEFPQFGRFLNVPGGCIVQVTLASAVYDTIKAVSFYEADPVFNQVIRSDKFLEVGDVGVFRNQMIAPLCLKPFLYDSITGNTKVLKQCNIQIIFKPSHEGKTLPVQARSSASWENLTHNLVLNPAIDTPRSETTPGSMVIIYNGSSALASLQPLINWKHRKGFEVHAVSLAEIGTTTTAIKNYLQNAYNTWENPPEYVLLVGDATGATMIPTFVTRFVGQPAQFITPGDNDYVKLAGNDDYPDAYIGRLSYTTTTELNTMVNRILNYEKNVNLGTDSWFERTLLVGDPTNSGTSTITASQYIKGLIKDYNPSQGITEIYAGSFPSQISSAINQGVSAYYYRGFGDFSGFGSAYTNALINSGKFPVITFLTCFAGDYASMNVYYHCLGELFMKLGTPSAPKGAIAFYAPTSETHTCFNNLMTSAFAYGLYKEGDTNPGQAVLRSKLALIANYPSNPQDFVKQYLMANNLLGDPSTELWLKQPGTMVADHQVSVSPGNGSVLITVHDNQGLPLRGAWVCLQKGADEIFVSGYSDEAGEVVLSYTGASAGSCNLTITKQHFTPVLSTIMIGTVHADFEFSSFVTSTPFQSGSIAEFQLIVRNNSASPVTGVVGEISSGNPYITILTASSGYPLLEAGAEGESSSKYSIRIDEACPKGSDLPLQLTIHVGEQAYVSNFSIRENGLLFQIDAVQIGTAGNTIYTGETQPLFLTLRNLSIWQGEGIHTALTAPIPMITFPAGSQDISIIPAGAAYTNEIPYQVHVDEAAISGQLVHLVLHMYSLDGWEQDIPFAVQLGQSVPDDPTGPDPYGYFCIESRDACTIPSPDYQWVELDPSLGGTGTDLGLEDTDTTGSGSFSTVMLPFPFQFYGQSYDQITISSNGFIMPGSQGSVEWMNWSIPGPMVPRPLIAPFWDDLLTINGGRVLYEYHPELQAMIIEWSNMRSGYDSTTVETFAVWLYEAPADTALSSDNPITFQYKEIGNIDAGSYFGDFVSHGEYATVGIADHTGMRGLLYTYSNDYPQSARTLANETALRFESINQANLIPAPDHITVTMIDEVAVLYWNVVPGATAYKVYWASSPSAGITEWIPLATVQTNQYQITDTSNHHRFYRVTATR